MLAPQIAFAAWWNPISWFPTEIKLIEQEQPLDLVSSSTQPKPQTASTQAPDTKTIEGLREEVAVLKARLADLESRFNTPQTSTVVQPALTGPDIFPRVVALEKRVDALSNPDTSRLSALEKKVVALSGTLTASTPPQAKNYDLQISEMAKRINALMHTRAPQSGGAITCTLGQTPRGKADEIYPSCASVYADLNY